LTEAVALVERMPMVGRHFNGNVDLRVVVNLQKGHVQGLRQRLYESLDDACSGTAAGEREKLAWVGRARAAMDRFAQVCRAEVVGRIPGPWLKKTGAVGRLVQRLYDGLNI
jgi:hypothetical protein